MTLVHHTTIIPKVEGLRGHAGFLVSTVGSEFSNYGSWAGLGMRSGCGINGPPENTKSIHIAFHCWQQALQGRGVYGNLRYMAPLRRYDMSYTCTGI